MIMNVFNTCWDDYASPSTTAIQDKAQAALQQQQPLNQKHQVAGPPMTSVYSLGQRDLGKPQAPLYITAGQSRSIRTNAPGI